MANRHADTRYRGRCQHSKRLTIASSGSCCALSLAGRAINGDCRSHRDRTCANSVG